MKLRGARNSIDFFVQAIDLAKEKEVLSNQEKLILNRFKISLRSGAVEDADSEIARVGRVRKKTIHKVRELAESIFEDWVRNMDMSVTERDRILSEGKMRADYSEDYLLMELQRLGLVYND